jgi:hypothetical protein
VAGPDWDRAAARSRTRGRRNRPQTGSGKAKGGGATLLAAPPPLSESFRLSSVSRERGSRFLDALQTSHRVPPGTGSCHRTCVQSVPTRLIHARVGDRGQGPGDPARDSAGGRERLPHRAITDWPALCQLASHLASTPRRIYLPRLDTCLPQDNHSLGSVPFPRHPIGHSGRDVVREYQPAGLPALRRVPVVLASRSTTARICLCRLPTSVNRARLPAPGPPQDPSRVQTFSD